MASKCELYSLLVGDLPEPYLITPCGDMSFDEVLALSSEITEYPDIPGLDTIVLEIANPVLLISFIYGCLQANVSFILLPPGTNKEFVNNLLAESGKCLYFENINGSIVKEIINGKLARKQETQIGFLSSGTTGSPQLLWVTYEQIYYTLTAVQRCGYFSYNRNKNVYITAPFFHSYGFSSLLEYSLSGSKIITTTDSGILNTLNILTEKTMQLRLTAIEGVPYFYDQLLALKGKIQLPYISHIGFGGDAVDKHLVEKISGFFEGATFSVRYGVTEFFSAVSVNCFACANNLEIKKTKILPIYTIKIKKIDASNCGEVVVSYKQKVLANRYPPVATGDIGRIQDGMLCIEGRSMAFFKYKGIKINPVYLESAAISTTMVKEAKCYENNHKLILEIVPIPANYSKSKFMILLKKALLGSCHPDKIIEVPELERTRTGKLLRWNKNIF